MKLSYTVEELLLDESFVDYCLHPDSEHRAKWEKIKEEYDGMAATMEEAHTWLNMLSPGLPPEEIQAEIQKFRTSIAERDAAQQIPAIETARPRRKKLWLAAACITLLLAGAGWWWTSVFSQPGQSPFITGQVYESPAGQRRQFQLPDGSSVILNASSRLEVSNDFNSTSRRLQLRGQAFFQVAHNAHKPFIVESGSFSTTALGTAFYVNARDAAIGYSVNLLEGKVQLKNKDGVTDVLLPGEQGTWKNGERQFAKTGFDSNYLNRWVSGVLAFQRAEAGQAFSLLEQWYGVSILDQRKQPRHIVITGDYTGQPLQDILKAICFSLSCQFRQQGDTIIIE